MEINQAILTAKELTVHYGEQIILDKASLSIHEFDKIGLIGRNGCGKSSFLKIISDVMSPDYGEVTRKKGLVTGFLSQEFTLNEEKTVLENILDGASNITNLIDEYEKLPYDSPNKEKLEVIITKKDGWNLNKKIDNLITSLNAPPQDKIVSTLSGGEKRRVALCRALISEPDLLILDEPTNHLDTASIEWIENFLQVYQGSCIFVTHDRYFLDRIATRIVELSGGTFYSHQGNYTDYLINKAERQAIKEAEEDKRQNFLRRELDWVSRGPKARTSKSKSRLDKYYEVASKEYQVEELDVDLLIPPYEKPGNTVLDIHNLEYRIDERILFRELNFNFKAGRKLGIIGKNGAGKTTLLKILLGELKPSYGMFEVGEKTEFNYVDQSRMLLDDTKTVFESLSDGGDFIKFGNKQINVWTYLRKFLFTDDRINTLVGRLSGGERSRLTLAKILKNGGNFLILDEPTNDLDLPTLRVLEESLISFQGCLIIVSHDRYFLNRVCNGILAFEDNGSLYFSEGDYDYYLEKRRDYFIPKPEKKEKREDTRVKIKTRKLTWKENKELENIETTILEAEAEVERIEGIFASPDFYEKHATRTNQLNEELNEAKAKVNLLYERWSELEEIKNSSDN